MSQGIVGLVRTMATLIFVIPLVLAGAELLLAGRLPLGVGFFAAALAMIAVDQYVTTPGDLPELVASKIIGLIAQESEEG